MPIYVNFGRPRRFLIKTANSHYLCQGKWGLKELGEGMVEDFYFLFCVSLQLNFVYSDTIGTFYMYVSKFVVSAVKA